MPMSWGRGRGPVGELLSLAGALQRAGADVAFAARPRFHRWISDMRFDIVASLPERADPPIRELFFDDFAAFQGLSDSSFVATTVEAELAAIRTFRPDLVFAYLQPTCAISTRSLGISSGAIARWSRRSGC